ncbi:MAG: MlaD family protein [Defluviicoccus sp.]
MTPDQTLAHEPQPVLVDRRRRISLVWLVPLVAVLIGGWLAYKTITEAGPTIRIAFETAEGLEAGKTKIRHKDVEIGIVETVRFSDDLKHVIVTAKMVKEMERHLTEGARFWVVRPRLSASGVSGLSTLVSGAYIAFDLGEGAPTREFTGLEVPPVVAANVPGKEYVLKTSELGSLGVGVPIFYRGVQAGEVMGYKFADDWEEIIVPIFIRTPFDQLVHAGSRFWNASGIDVTVSADGVNVTTESVQAILTGGIAFDSPVVAPGTEPSPAGTVFSLYSSHASISEAQYTVKIPYRLYFDGSVRGLSTGAPVEFRGIKIGSVTDVRLEYDVTSRAVRIPVTIEIEPQRIDIVDGAERPVVTGGDLGDRRAAYARMEAMVANGLRAQLLSGSLVTGQLLVALDFHPEAPAQQLKIAGPYPEIPTIPSDLEKITRSVEGVISKIAALPLDTITAEMKETVHTVNMLINSPAVTRAVTSLDGVAPLIEGARKTADAAAATLQSTSDMIGANSQLRRDMTDLLRELKDAARSLRALADYLERHPDALIRGKSGDTRR